MSPTAEDLIDQIIEWTLGLHVNQEISFLIWFIQVYKCLGLVWGPLNLGATSRVFSRQGPTAERGCNTTDHQPSMDVSTPKIEMTSFSCGCQFLSHLWRPNIRGTREPCTKLKSHPWPVYTVLCWLGCMRWCVYIVFYNDILLSSLDCYKPASCWTPSSGEDGVFTPAPTTDRHLPEPLCCRLCIRILPSA